MNNPSICLNFNFFESIQCAYIEFLISENNTITITNYNSLLMTLMNIIELKSNDYSGFINKIFSEDKASIENIFFGINSQEHKFTTHFRLGETSSTKWIKTNVVIEKMADHKKVHMFLADISPIKEAQIEKDKLTEQLSMVVDNTDSVVLQFSLDKDLNMEFLYISNGFQSMYGLNPKDVYRSPELLTEQIHSDDMYLILDAQKKLIVENKDCDLKYRIKVEGSLKWVHIRAKVFSSDKDIVLVNAIILDITKQRELEFKTENQSQFLKSITDNMDGAVYEFCQSPKGEFFIPYISDGVYQLYNIYPEEIYKDSQRVFRVICPEYIDRVLKDIQASYDNNKNFYSEFRVTINRKIKWISARSKIQIFEDGSASWRGLLLDITKEKELEMEKERISDQLRMAADNIDGVVYQFQRDRAGIYSITYISDGVQSIYNISPKNAYDDVNYLFDAIHKDDIERVAQSIEKSYQENKNWDCQYRLLINNKIKWIQARSKIKKLSNNETIWNGVKIDITNQKEIENKLKEQYDFFILLAKESNTIFGVYEISGELSYISPNAEKILGYSLHELKSNTDVFIYKEDKNIVANALEEVISEKTDHKVYTHRYQKKNKSVGLLSVSLLLINTNEGRKISLTARDITQLKKLETDLAETTKKYKLFVEQSELKILSVDLNYNVNHMTGTFPEFKKEDLIGKSLKMFHSKNSWKTIVEPKYQQAINTKKTIVYENSYIKCGKEEFYVEFVTPIIKNDKVKSLLLASKQITQQKKLEKDNQMLLREVHHRVKNNLQIIMSLIDIQLDQISDNGICNVFSELKLRIKAISYVHSKLVITNNVGSLSIKEYSNTMIDKIKALYDSNKTNVKITSKFEHYEINVENAVRFGLLLTEIVSNCFKHAFSENTKDAAIDISLKTLNKNIIFIVKDNGKGFAENILKNSKSNSNSFGLQFIQGLVKSLEGKISVKNSLGAEVCCVFPYNYLFEIDTMDLKK